MGEGSVGRGKYCAGLVNAPELTSQKISLAKVLWCILLVRSTSSIFLHCPQPVARYCIDGLGEGVWNPFLWNVARCLYRKKHWFPYCKHLSKKSFFSKIRFVEKVLPSLENVNPYIHFTTKTRTKKGAVWVLPLNRLLHQWSIFSSPCCTLTNGASKEICNYWSCAGVLPISCVPTGMQFSLLIGNALSKDQSKCSGRRALQLTSHWIS